MNARRILITTGLALSVVLGAQAQTTPAANSTSASATAGAASAVEGEVRKVDKEAAKLTLRHGPLTDFDMPAMTMVFRVADPKMLEQVKAGDKVRFTAARVDGQFTVTQIEASN